MLVTSVEKSGGLEVGVRGEAPVLWLSVGLIAAVALVAGFFLYLVMSSGGLEVTLDKAVYRVGENVTINITNLSEEKIYFPDGMYGLQFQIRAELGWDSYLAPVAPAIVGFLEPGESGTVTYRLGQETSAPFDPGVYRVEVSGWIEDPANTVSAYQEFRVAG